MLSAVATGWNQNLVSARVISVGHLTWQSLTSSSFHWTRVLITGWSLKSARATIDVFVQDRLGNPAESFYQDIYWAIMKAEVTAFTIKWGFGKPAIKRSVLRSQKQWIYCSKSESPDSPDSANYFEFLQTNWRGTQQLLSFHCLQGWRWHFPIIMFSHYRF